MLKINVMGKIMMKKYRNLILAYGFDGIDIDKVFYTKNYLKFVN